MAVEGKKSFNPEIYLPWLIFAVTFLWRFYYIPLRDISLDEPFTIFHAQESIKDILALPTRNEPNPPLFMALMHFWIKIFGIGSYSVRSLPLFFNALNAVFIYLLGKKILNTWGGLIASGMFIISIYQFFFGTEARTYSLQLCATASAMYFLFSMLMEPSKRRYKIGLFVSNLVLIYSHYFGWFVVFMEFITVMICFRNTKTLKKTLLVLLLTAISYLPMLKIVINQFFISKDHTWVRPPSNYEFWNQLVFFMNGRNAIYTAFILFGAGIIFYLLMTRKKKFPLYILLLFVFWFTPYSIMFLVSGKVPMFENRYVMYNSVGLYLFTGTFLAWLFERWKPAAIFAGTVLIGVMATGLQINSKEFGYREVNKTVNYLKGKEKEGAIILIHPRWTDLGFVYYYDKGIFRNVPKYDSLLQANSIFPVWGIKDAKERIKAHGTGQVIYYQDGSQANDPDNTIFRYLDSIAVRTDSIFFPQTFYVSTFELKTDSVIAIDNK